MTITTETSAQPGAGRRPQDVVVEGTVRFGAGRLRWELMPWSMLRTPGFPVDALASLADPGLLDADDRSAALRDERDAVREEFLRDEPAGLTGTLRRDVRRAVAAGLPVGAAEATAWAAAAGDRPAFPGRWNALLGRVAAAEAEASGRWAQAQERATRRLSAICADPRLQHAVFLSSQSFYQHGLTRVTALGTREPDKRDRKALATAARYLRRLSVRCEQTSFFGPTHFVHLDPEAGPALSLGEPGPERVFAEPGIWLLDLLARAGYATGPAEERRPRRHPLFRLGDGRLVSALDGRFKRASEPALRLWRELDGERTLPQACAAAGLPESEGPALLAALGPTVIRQIPLASHEMDPLARLVAAEPDPAGPAHRMAEATAAFAAAPWPQRRTAFAEAEAVAIAMGAETRRGEGSHYADRYVLHEERAHPLSARTVLGGAAVRGLRSALDAVLPLSFLGALLDREDAREALRAATGGRPVPLARAGSLDLPVVTRRADALRADLAALVTGRTGSGGSANLTAADIAALVERHAPRPDPDDLYATLAGPDLMAAGPWESATWVLSELHDDGSYVAGAVTRLHPEGAALRADFERRVVEVIDPAAMAAVISRRRNKFLVPEMPGLGVEVGGFSTKPRSRTVGVSEVDIDGDGTAVLVGGRRLRLYSGDIPSAVHRALAVPALNPVPVDTGAFTPRIVIDGVVVQRARWRLEIPGALRGERGWAAAQRMRREAGLPRRVFVRHPAEPKPLFVDFADPYAVADLMRLPGGRIAAGEMLPDYPDLWWRPEGGAVCAELRTSCLVRWDFGPADTGR